MNRHSRPVLRPGDGIQLDGRAWRVVGLDGTSVRLVDEAGQVSVMLTGHLLSDPTFQLSSSAPAQLPALRLLEQLPAELRAQAQWWEQHLVEILTGLAPDAAAGVTPRPEYDPNHTTLRRRELAKQRELAAAGHMVPLSTLQRLRRRYELQGLSGLVDQRVARTARGGGSTGRVDPRVVAAIRQAISEETNRSTGTVERLRRRVTQLVAAEPDPPAMPSQRTFYRLVERLATGKHTFGSARTRRSLAKQPPGPFGVFTATRPGEWTQIDSTPLDVRVVTDDGLVDRVELTGLVDVATRTVAAAVLRPTTKAVDAALLLARSVTPEPMRPGWTDALRMSRSVLPYTSMTAIDRRLTQAAARPVIVPETIVCDHGKAYLSTTFRAACRSLGISLQPAHPDTPTDKPTVERTLESVGTLFAQHVAGYVGSSVERRGDRADQHAVWSMTQLQGLLDEWIVTVWQNRPHEGLRDPLTPDTALSPNERYAALIAHAGYVPVPLSPVDYVELLPSTWRTINSYGIKLGRRTYDAAALNPYRRQHSGVADKRGRWQVHHDPYDISRVWVRNHHTDDPDQPFIQASWTHLRSAPAPFGEAIWTHARDLITHRGSDPATEAEIAASAARLLDVAEHGPPPSTPSTTPTPSRRTTPRNRRALARARAASPSIPPPPEQQPTSGDQAPSDNQLDHTTRTSDQRQPDDEQLAPVIPLGVFDPRAEAQKWW